MKPRQPPEKWECPRCEKTSYASEFRAWKAIGAILRTSPDNSTVPCRVYPCPYGEGFHLTSRRDWP